MKSFSLHDLRDTHASLLAKNGVPLDVVSKHVGHGSTSVTQQYVGQMWATRKAQVLRSRFDAAGPWRHYCWMAVRELMQFANPTGEDFASYPVWVARHAVDAPPSGQRLRTKNSSA
jgi:hypothetical protein